MDYDVIIAGGGIAGLTAAAYLTKYGYKTLVCEKQLKTGGLVNSFNQKGFVLDGGIRAIENLGIIRTMLKKLDIELEFIENRVSIGMEDTIVDVISKDSLYDYRQMLDKYFPDNTDDIQKIIEEIQKIMHYMDIQYGIDNPLFLDVKEDREYFIKIILPWMFKYASTVGKISKLKGPVEDYLGKFTDNRKLIDIISQHFFTNTPAFFALSYFSLYLDYKYPKGGTGSLTDGIRDYIIKNGGEIATESEIVKVDIEKRNIIDSKGNNYNYNKLIWAADAKLLSKTIQTDAIENKKLKANVISYKNFLEDKTGGNSVLTIYALCDTDRSYFKSKSGAHLFYTPYNIGLSKASFDEIKTNTGEYITNKNKIFEWLKKFYKYNTFEISIPVIRDESLAPKGKTGLIISILMDYCLVKHILELGWYEEFKSFSQNCILDILYDSIYPEIKNSVTDVFCSTPITIEKMTNNTDGAITGWSFTNKTIPSINKLPAIAKSANTPYPDVYMAGQWSYSPSGLPISVLTGKLAADKVKKNIKPAAL